MEKYCGVDLQCIPRHFSFQNETLRYVLQIRIQRKAILFSQQVIAEEKLREWE